MSWADLFERAEAYAVDEAAVLEAFAERRRSKDDISEEEDGP